MSYYENDWKKALSFICDGLKMTTFATVLWVYALYLIAKHVFSRITEPRDNELPQVRTR